jgi:hypothetical protein
MKSDSGTLTELRIQHVIFFPSTIWLSTGRNSSYLQDPLLVLEDPPSGFSGVPHWASEAHGSCILLLSGGFSQNLSSFFKILKFYFQPAHEPSEFFISIILGSVESDLYWSVGATFIQIIDESAFIHPSMCTFIQT